MATVAVAGVPAQHTCACKQTPPPRQTCLPARGLRFVLSLSEALLSFPSPVGLGPALTSSVLAVNVAERTNLTSRLPMGDKLKADLRRAREMLMAPPRRAPVSHISGAQKFLFAANKTACAAPPDALGDQLARPPIRPSVVPIGRPKCSVLISPD
jgi:hypothetical protein